MTLALIRIAWSAYAHALVLLWALVSAIGVSVVLAVSYFVESVEE